MDSYSDDEEVDTTPRKTSKKTGPSIGGQILSNVREQLPQDFGELAITAGTKVIWGVLFIAALTVKNMLLTNIQYGIQHPINPPSLVHPSIPSNQRPTPPPPGPSNSPDFSAFKR